MKKKIGIILLVSTLLFSIFAFTACGKEDPFIGSFSSVWIEGNNTEVTFNLTISSDRTFSLERIVNDTKWSSNWTRSGTWAGNDSNDDYGIICFISISTVSASSESTSSESTSINYYFTLTRLDDGRIAAASGAASAFSTGAGYIVIFEKSN